MNKIKFLTYFLVGTMATTCYGENLFWTFDDNQTPITIPSECDARFDEVHGGVFTPTVDELYSYGKEFLKADTLSVKQQGAYCILGAAWQGKADAQYILAKIYQEGKILPKDNLSAYKWAFIAALNGSKDAERLTLLLEQYLTTKELEKTTQPIQDTQKKIQENLNKKNEKKEGKDKKEEAHQAKQGDTQPATKGVEGMKEILPDVNNIFTEKDRMK